LIRAFFIFDPRGIGPPFHASSDQIVAAHYSLASYIIVGLYLHSYFVAQAQTPKDPSS